MKKEKWEEEKSLITKRSRVDVRTIKGKIISKEKKRKPSMEAVKGKSQQLNTLSSRRT